MSITPNSLPLPESDAEPSAVIARCNQLFERALFEPELVGFSEQFGHRSEYMTLVDTDSGDSIFLYRDDVRFNETATYPFRVMEELDGRDIHTGEPSTASIQCFIDRFGDLHMPLSNPGGSLILVAAPKGLSERYTDIVLRGTPARLA